MMKEKNDVIQQTNLAFEFIQKLYLEASYLIKEIEGILREEKESFIIGRPSGYGISTRSSTGLESNNVMLWLVKKFAVFFVPEDKTELKGGQTRTRLDKDLKVLYLRILLSQKDALEPVIWSGVLFGIQKKPQAKGITKFENIMSHIEYNDSKIFTDHGKVKYEDTYMQLRGELLTNKLFDVNDSDTIVNKIIRPALNLYRKIPS